MPMLVRELMVLRTFKYFLRTYYYTYLFCSIILFVAHYLFPNNSIIITLPLGHIILYKILPSHDLHPVSN